MDWEVPASAYDKPHIFPRLKALGFENYHGLYLFMHTLDHLVQATAYQLDLIVRLLNEVEPKLPAFPYDIPKLKQIARAWMDDVHDMCNAAQYADQLDPERVGHNLAVRQFRQARPWLVDNFGGR